jgi:hypothetical protein
LKSTINTRDRNDEPVDLARTGRAQSQGSIQDQPDDRHPGPGIGSPEVGKAGVRQHRQGLGADLVLLAVRPCSVGRESAAPPPRGRAQAIQEALQQAVHQEAALEAVAALSGGDRVAGSGPSGATAAAVWAGSLGRREGRTARHRPTGRAGERPIAAGRRGLRRAEA